MRQTRPCVHRVVALAIPLLALSVACTSVRVQPQLGAAAPRAYSAIAVGEIAIDDSASTPLLAAFHEGLLKGFADAHLPAATFNPLAVSDSGAVVLSGRIVRFDRGSAAARWLVGFGAGAAKVRGTFTLTTVAGDTLAAFEAEESYRGGAGIGGVSFISFQDLVERFGRTVASKTAGWARGQPIR
jgi:hypothetical protein